MPADNARLRLPAQRKSPPGNRRIAGDNAGLRLPAQPKSPPGNHSNHSRHVTERAGPRPIGSYEPRKCAENNVAVKAANLRQTSVSHQPQKSAFLSGSGGLSLRKQQRKPPGLSVAGCNRQVTGRQAALISGAKSRIVSGHSPPKPRIISGDTPEVSGLCGGRRVSKTYSRAP